MRLRSTTRTHRIQSITACAVALAACVAMGCEGSIGDHLGEDDPGTIPATGQSSPGPEGNTCTAAPPIVPQRLWRLSNAQYSNAVRDLLGIPTGPTVTGGGESLFSFFSADTETVSDALAFSYAQAAEDAAAKSDPRALAPCAAVRMVDACAGEFIPKFLSRAFRRPATPAEIAAMTGVYQAGAPDGYDAAIRLVIEATLQSPSFVYRTEIGQASTPGRANLTSYEVASELSFLFLDSGPDDALWSAASSHELEIPEGVSKQVDRLLAVPAVQANLTRVVVDWLGARQVISKSKTDPRWNDDVKNDLITESRLFLHDLLWKTSGAIGDLWTSPRTFLNSRLATLYGVSATGATTTDFVPFTFPPGQRAGILTQGSIMATHADVEETSVVLRGKFVRNDVLCLTALPPPPGVASRPDIVAALAAAKTQRAKAEYRASNMLCNSCHGGLDPLGLTFEEYDPVGRYRTEANGQAVDAAATFDPANFDDDPALSGRIDGASALAGRIASEGTFATACAVQKLTSYSIGRWTLRSGSDAESCQLQAIGAALASDRATIPALIRTIAVSSLLRDRSVGGAQ
jgi:hypothetical protein